MQRALAAFRAVFRPVWRDERGVTLAITAVMMTALLAITGLAVDAGWWYALHRQNQSAADNAVISAAFQIVNARNNTSLPDPTQSQLVPFASDAARQNGYAGTTPEVAFPYNRDLNKVEVRLHQPQSTWFAALANIDSVTIANRAVAGIKVLDNPCTYILDPTADQALAIKGSASLTTPSCSICVNSNADDAVYMQGATNAVLTADALLIRGEISSTGQPNLTLKNPTQFGFTGCTDPYASTLIHSTLIAGMPSTVCDPATITTDPDTGVVTVPAGCAFTGADISAHQGTIKMSGDTQISGGWDIKNETVNLAPGTYWITDGDLNVLSGGTLECTACTPGGDGVTLILTTAKTSNGLVGNVSAGSNGVVDNLNAPGDPNATFSNLMLIQDSNELPTGTTFTTPCRDKGTSYSCSQFQGGPNQSFTGLVYFPDSALDFQGNPSTGNYQCLLTVAKTMSLQGNPTGFATQNCPTTGLGAVKKVYTAALVE